MAKPQSGPILVAGDTLAPNPLPPIRPDTCRGQFDMDP
jgi:hypothetical protein